MTDKDTGASSSIKESEPKLIEKDSDKWSLTKIAKGYRNTKRVAKYAGATALVAGGAALALPFLGVVMLFGLALGAIAFLATIAYTVQRIRTAKGAEGVMSMLSKAANSVSEQSAASTAGASENRSTAPNEKPMVLWDMHGTVCLFGVEPTIQEIILANNTTTSMPGLTRVPNGENVSILLDEGRDAVKIKVVAGEHNGHVAWVSRSNLLISEKQAV